MICIDTFYKFVPIIGIIIAYGLLYTLYFKINPDSFNFEEDCIIDPFYFSTTTLSSVGYGDLRPRNSIAKGMVMSQQLIIIFEVLKWFG